MSNRTCGDCRFLESAKKIGFCEKQKLCLCPEELPSCSNFEQKVVTNLEMIRQINDEYLIKVLSDGCPPFGDNSDKCKHPTPDFSCKDCWREWLNAPADNTESEVKNG